MSTFSAWYSAIQYATGEGDRVNIGVLLHVPTTGELRVRFGSYRKRLCPSHATEADVDFLDQEVDSLHEWARVHAGRVDRANLEDTFARESGIVRFETLRGIRVRDTASDLDRLCQEVAGGPDPAATSRERPISRILELLDSKLRPLEEEHRLHFRTRVRIPGFEIVMPVHYQYRNGVDTYVVAEFFGGRRRQVIDRAASIAVRGRQLVQATKGRSRLSVITCYEDETLRSDTEPQLDRLFHEHEVRSISSHRLDGFVAEVREHAHPWF